MNKELVEKMHKAIANNVMKMKLTPGGTVHNVNLRDASVDCAAVASEHYGDNWHKCSEQMPEEGHECVIIVAGMRGTAIYAEVNGTYQFVNENYEGSCAELEQDAITHWMSITELPQPPQQ